MQRPTITGIRVRTPSDAHAIFHAVSLKMLPIVSRRLDTEERRLIASGCVFVWEERGPNAESSCVRPSLPLAASTAHSLTCTAARNRAVDGLYTLGTKPGERCASSELWLTFPWVHSLTCGYLP